ncbi:MAG: TetR/AcrR family transcriptional regulator [Solirubrobacterales bacterium]|nr:TetR/AcrR family transcriptional regulator [Solirubrobacterales bacterium]
MTSPRRQQSDRTAATRTSVLEATVELLIERGYAGTSTRLAAERAGVSLGALQHHFRTKAELSVEAMRYVTQRLAEEFVAAAPESDDVIDRFGSILDRLLVVFRGPTFAAAVEIQLASRTDDELQQPVRDLHDDVEEIIFESATSLLPEFARLPEFPAVLQTSVSAVRGLAITTMDPITAVEEQWTLVRGQLLEIAGKLEPGAP